MSSMEEAERISRELLENRLVACANIFPIRSLYWWENEIADEQECVAIFKTKSELIQQAMALIKKLHTYDIPCLLSYECVSGEDDYLRWIDDSTRKA